MSLKFDWSRRAQDSIHHAALTNSKRTENFTANYPTHYESGNGCYLYTPDKTKYTDFICALGTNLFGYNNQHINKAVQAQMAKGSLLSFGTTLEVECAEKIKELFPFIQKVRFLKTGTESTMSAIRIARAHHGVCYDNEKMYEVLGNPAFGGIQQDEKKQNWIAGRMQEMRLRILETTEENTRRSFENIRDKSSLSKNGKRDHSEERGPENKAGDSRGSIEDERIRQETQQNTTGIWESENIQACSEVAAKEAVRSLWGDGFGPCSPRGLFQAARGELALPKAPHGETPRVLILSDGYHGAVDSFIGLTNPHHGVIKDPYLLPLKGNEDLIPIAAGVIIEPVITDYGPERIKYLQDLREETKKHDTLLIFDEIITGFRWPKYSVANDTGVRPDIICLGKAMGGGLPLSVVGTANGIGAGKDWFVSGTFYGDTLALAAFKEVTNLLKNTHTIADLWKHGEYFKNEFNKICPDLVSLSGYPSRSVFTFRNDVTKALFFQESCRAGIIVGPSFFFNFKHIEIMDIVLNSFKDILNKIKNNKLELEGPMPVVPYAQKQRETK